MYYNILIPIDTLIVQYPQPITDAYLKELDAIDGKKKTITGTVDASGVTTFSEADILNTDAQKDTPDVPMRFSEKRRLHWKGLTCM